MTHEPSRRGLSEAASKPFPWRCPNCLEEAVYLQTIPYVAEMKHDGRSYTVEVPDLQMPVCRSCGEQVISDRVDDQLRLALRRQARLLTPLQIRQGREA